MLFSVIFQVFNPQVKREIEGREESQGSDAQPKRTVIPLTVPQRVGKDKESWAISANKEDSLSSLVEEPEQLLDMDTHVHSDQVPQFRLVGDLFNDDDLD